MNFGLGCQILDDLRDLARDLNESRHNYVLSLLQWEHPERLAKLKAGHHGTDSRSYRFIPAAITRDVARLGFKMMHNGLMQALNQDDSSSQSINVIARRMFRILDLEELATTSG